MDDPRCDDGPCPRRRCGPLESRYLGVACGRSPTRAERLEIRARGPQWQMSFEREVKNPDQDQTQDTDNHHKASNRVLPASGAQVPVVRLVVPESSRTLFGERRWTAALAELPCFPAIAPSSDFGSGNEVIVAWHGRFFSGSPPPVNNPLLHQPSRGDPSARSSGFVRA